MKKLLVVIIVFLSSVSINLSSVAGEWAGFDEEWLVKRICQKSESESLIPKPIQKIFRIPGFKAYVEEHWEKIHPKINEAREKA